MPWAELFRRVFREDLLICPRCTGTMRVLAAITDPIVVDAILTHLGLPTEPPAIAAARAPPQVPLWPGALDPDSTPTIPRRPPLSAPVPRARQHVPGPWLARSTPGAPPPVPALTFPFPSEATRIRQPELAAAPADAQTALMRLML